MHRNVSRTDSTPQPAPFSPMSRSWLFMRLQVMLVASLIVVMTSSSAAAAMAQGQSPPPGSGQAARSSEPIAWLEAEEAERETVLRMLHSDDWPFRVFGLLRLQRYTGNEVIELLGKRLHDDIWQVRCFAIQQSVLMDIPLTASDLSRERDPRVLRTALRQGIEFPDGVVQPIAERLLRGRTLDDLLLGIELAASSNIKPLRAQAKTTVSRMILNMNNAIAAYASRRLSRVLGQQRPIKTVNEWRQWLNSVRGTIEFSVAANTRSPLAGVSIFERQPVFVEMDNASFARLVDYLSVLSQREIDLVVVMDITESMAPMLAEAQAGVDSLMQFMNDITRHLRLGVVAYRDHDNPPVWQGHPFTTDINTVRDFLFKLTTQGGADLPEAVFDGLAACRQMQWNREATRQIILVGDAPPHERDHEKLENLMYFFADANIFVHAVHVPMQRDPRRERMMTPEQRAADDEFLSRYNSHTARVFNDITRHGGGQFTTLDEAENLVPSIMHFAIDREWWGVFDAFYQQYLDLCR